MVDSVRALERLSFPLVVSPQIVLKETAAPAVANQTGKTPQPVSFQAGETQKTAADADAESPEQVQVRMQAAAAELGLCASLVAVDPHPPYYEQTLEWRRDRLGANSVDELCKSVVMENTKLEDDAEQGRVRCVLVVAPWLCAGLFSVLQGR